MNPQTIDLTLDGKLYRLASISVQDRAVGYARSWSSEKVPKTTKIEQRADVQKGALQDEYICIYDDFSQGVCGYRKHVPGRVHHANNADLSMPGVVRTVGQSIRKYHPFAKNVGSFTNDAMYDHNVPICEFNGKLYAASGNRVFRVNMYESAVPGAGVGIADDDIITDMKVFNGNLYVACGSTHPIVKMTSGEVFSYGDSYADYLCVVENFLWRAYNGEVANCDTSDDPTDESDWSSGIEVGDPDKDITALCSIGEKIGVCKEDGLYLGDANAIFPNVLPQFESTPSKLNGSRAQSFGAAIFYPHENGLIRYEPGISPFEVGLAKQMPTIDRSKVSYTNSVPPGFKVKSMCADAGGLWVATYPNFQFLASPSKVMKRDGSSTVTDCTSTVTDNSLATSVQITLSPGSDGAWSALAVGYTAPFYGVYLEFQAPSSVAFTLAAIGHSSDESWSSALDISTATYLFVRDIASSHYYQSVVDMTHNKRTFARAGLIYWRELAMATWNANLANWDASSGYYWVVIYLNYVASTQQNARISGVKILTSKPASSIYRVTPSNEDIVKWAPFFQPYTSSTAPETNIGDIKGLISTSTVGGAGEEAPVLVMSGNSIVEMKQTTSHEIASGHSALSIVTGMDDFGINEDKEFIDVYVKVKTPTNAQYVRLYYRVDDDDSWQTAIEPSYLTESGVFTLGATAIKGKAIQLKLATDAYTNSLYPIEIYELWVRFRMLYGTAIGSFKMQYTFTLELGNSQRSSYGAPLPQADTQLSNLEALLGAGPVTMVDPIGRTKTVHVNAVKQVEYLQDATDMPVMRVQITCTEA